MNPRVENSKIEIPSSSPWRGRLLPDYAIRICNLVFSTGFDDQSLICGATGLRGPACQRVDTARKSKCELLSPFPEPK